MTQPLLLPAPDIGRYLNRVTCAEATDFLRGLPTGSVQTLITSPPYYGLRDYGVDGQIGLEETPAEFVAKLVAVFREARRVLRDDGTLWINLGDSYSRQAGDDSKKEVDSGFERTGRTGKQHMLFKHGNNRPPEGIPAKNLLGIPWRAAFALQDDGWILRSDIIWSKPNPMPESVTDRPTKAHEYVFLLSKKPHYYYDADAIREPHVRLWNHRNGGSMANVTAESRAMANGGRIHQGKAHSGSYPLPNPEGRNKRSVWECSTEPTPFAHFATFPTKLITPMILAGAPVGGVVLDPFAGSGTTILVARRLGRIGIGCDLNPSYVALANERLSQPYTPPLPFMFGDTPSSYDTTDTDQSDYQDGSPPLLIQMSERV